MTSVDMATLLSAKSPEKPGPLLPTFKLSCNFIGAALKGASIEARIEILRVTCNIVFSKCIVTADSKIE